MTQAIFLEIEVFFGQILLIFRVFQGPLAVFRVFGQILAIFSVYFGKLSNSGFFRVSGFANHLGINRSRVMSKRSDE